MRWDDIEILRKIDELEEKAPGNLNNAWTLMNQMHPAHTLQPGRDDRDFAHELVLAHGAGLITWRDYGNNVTPTNPETKPGNWLQEHSQIRLTLAGRDRARRRVFELPPPDPDEDDGRPITGATLDEIAQSISATFSDSQLKRFLEDSGIPSERIPSDPAGDGQGFVFWTLDRLQEGGAEARRILRAFIGRWLEGELHVPPAEGARRHIVALLGQQGWHLRDGRLVVGERTLDSAGVLIPQGRDVRFSGLHPTIRQIARPWVESGHPDAAIFEAGKALSRRVRELSGLDGDGTALMSGAFSGDDPRVALGDRSTKSGKNEHEGYGAIFRGVALAIRDQQAHEPFEDLSADEAFERLGLLSLLMRKLDEAAARTPTGG